MLREMKIKNLAIIDDLTIRFEKGLNVLTGETGAGKSIIVDALGLALGNRAQNDLIKSGAQEASVQAYFEVDDGAVPQGLDIDFTDGVLLRRVLSSGGKSRAYINDTMVTNQSLTEVGRSLVDILSQHEHQSLLSPEKQMEIVDNYGRLRADKEQVSRRYAETQSLRREYQELTTRGRERAQRLDMLKYQVAEIDAAGLVRDEKASLEEERNILAHRGKLIDLSETAYGLLYESEGSCAEKLSAAVSRLQEIREIDQGMDESLRLLESALPLILDASHALRGFRDRYDLDPQRLETIEDRLDAIRRLEKKYGPSIDAVLRYRDEADEEMKQLESSDERLASLEQELADSERALRRAAEQLSEKRGKTAGKIASLMEDNLKDLAFGASRFLIDVRHRTNADGSPEISASGMDEIQFLFSPNPGEPPKPLARIASGGELSRVMLVLKNILADVDNIPVLIFDEVDAGIGGKTAEHVGKRLDRIAERHQLLCITHLPQIARFGDFHLKIEKKLLNRKVRVEVTALSPKERQDEIARMLSGDITDISLKHAGELLEKTK